MFDSEGPSIQSSNPHLYNTSFWHTKNGGERRKGGGKKRKEEKKKKKKEKKRRQLENYFIQRRKAIVNAPETTQHAQEGGRKATLMDLDNWWALVVNQARESLHSYLMIQHRRARRGKGRGGKKKEEKRK